MGGDEDASSAVAGSDMIETGSSNTVQKLSPAQKQAGRFLARCQSEAVQVTVFADARADGLLELRSRYQDLKPTLTHLLMAALVRALEQHPHFNAHFEEDHLQLIDQVHLGLAVATPSGDLLTPVVRDLRGKSPLQIAACARAQAEKARAGALTLQDVRGASFTLSNVGQTRTVRYATPVLPLPQVAILATMAVRQEPVVRDGVPAAAWILPMSLTFDHRVHNGAAATSFLDTFATILEHPYELDAHSDNQEERP